MENVVVMENVFYKVRKKIILNAFFLFFKMNFRFVRNYKNIENYVDKFFIFYHSSLPFF